MRPVIYTLEVDEGKEQFVSSVMRHFSRVKSREVSAGRVTAFVAVGDEEERVMMEAVFRNLQHVRGVFANGGDGPADSGGLFMAA